MDSWGPAIVSLEKSCFFPEEYNRWWVKERRGSCVTGNGGCICKYYGGVQCWSGKWSYKKWVQRQVCTIFACLHLWNTIVGRSSRGCRQDVKSGGGS